MKINLQAYTQLIEDGLVRKKQVGNLVIIKYDRSVFFNNLWSSHPLLVEARGHVFFADTGELAVAPPTKVFNLGENGTDVNRDMVVSVVRKVNGFLACVTFINGEMVVSTTGSLDSDFVDLARKHVEKLDWDAIGKPEGQTFHFEICDESDPHICRELEGAYLIGQRSHVDLSSAFEFHLNGTAHLLKAMRPGEYSMKFGKLLEHMESVEHEGFMVRDPMTGFTLVKLKSNHYLSKKFLMRMGKSKARSMFEDPVAFKMKLDEEFHGVYDQIMEKYEFESWYNLTEQDRRSVIEDYLNE